MMNFANVISSGPFIGMGFGLFALGSILLLALMLAMIALKGYALWCAAKRDEKGWFIALLLINTFGILELVYLYWVVEKWNSPKAKVETKETPSSVPPSEPAQK